MCVTCHLGAGPNCFMFNSPTNNLFMNSVTHIHWIFPRDHDILPLLGPLVLLEPDEHALLRLLEQLHAELDPGGELVLGLGARVEVLLGEQLGDLAQRPEDGAALLLVTGVYDLVHAVHLLAVSLHLIKYCRVGPSFH